MERDLNRAEQLWHHWEEKQQQLERLLSATPDSAHFIRQRKYDLLREGFYRITAQPAEKEKLYQHAIALTMAKLQKQLYPHLVVRLLHRVKAFLYERPVHLRRFGEQKEESLELLKHRLYHLGIGSYTGKLEKYLDYESGHVNLEMTTQLPGNGTLDIQLRLERDSFGQYRFEEYRTTLSREGLPARSQTFYRDTTVTAKEAVNLLEGRAVRKAYEMADGSISHKWLQLDFENTLPDGHYKTKEFHQDFDLKKQMGELATKIGISRLAKEDMLRSMEQGHQACFKGPHPLYETLHLEVNPAEQSVLIRDKDRLPVGINRIMKKNEAAGKQDAEKILARVKQQEPAKEQNQSLSIG
ncbi:hypothetical protein [Mucilaginibacter sp.]